MRKIVLDPGHGGRDPGAVGNGLRESEVVLDLCRRVAAALVGYACEVRLTRYSDEAVTLTQRSRLANAWGADLFVSVHCNSAGQTTARGYETFHRQAPSPAALAAAQAVHGSAMALLSRHQVPDRGCKEHAKRLTVLHSTKMRALLLECLFVSNQREAALLAQDAFRAELAGAITRGIVSALDLRHLPAGISVLALGKPVPYPTGAPEMREGRVWAPARPLATALGARIAWDPLRYTVALWPAGGTRRDVPGELRDGTAWASVAEVAQALGARVEWVAEVQMVVITRR